MYRTAAFQGLRCFACDTAHDADRLQTVCTACGLPLRVDYALSPSTLPLSSLAGRAASLWRYREVLPLAAGEVSLGEGITPLVRLDERVLIKDEAQNPTGSFKARGMAAAVTMGRARRRRSCCAADGGQRAGALAAYGARAGAPRARRRHARRPRHALLDESPPTARTALVPGTIGDCGALAKASRPSRGRLTSRRCGSRIESRARRLGMEIAEQLGWIPPAAIIYPTGGGTGLIGMWKAFLELIEAGWIEGPMPRLCSVQATGCAPRR